MSGRNATLPVEADAGPVVHDHVLVEAVVDDQVVGFRGVVVNVQASVLWLGLPHPSLLLERLEPGQPLHLTFRRKRSATVADSAFVSHLGSGRSRLFTVERPSDLQFVQRRAHIRQDADLFIHLRVASHSMSGGAERIGTGRTRNVSAGGVQFWTDLAVCVGDQLEMAIVLGTNEIVPAEGQVIRVDDAPPDRTRRSRAGRTERPLFMVAVRFLSISYAAQDRIVRFIFAAQRARRGTPGRGEAVARRWS